MGGMGLYWQLPILILVHNASSPRTVPQSGPDS